MVLITCETKSKVSYTVDGTNPAPDRQFVSLFTRLYTSQDFFHQQYHNKNKEGYEHDIDSLINFDSGEFQIARFWLLPICIESLDRRLQRGICRQVQCF